RCFPVCIVLPHSSVSFFLFFLNDAATSQLYPLSLHDALPIFMISKALRMISTSASGWYATSASTRRWCCATTGSWWSDVPFRQRSEEHTSELQSLTNLVCRLLLEKKKKIHKRHAAHPFAPHTP